MVKPFLTIFTAPKPFTDPHICMIQRNALLSWLNLGDEVDVIMVGNEPGMREFSEQSGVRHLPEVALSAQGTPLVSSIFDLARRSSSSPLLAYLNADVLLTQQFVTVAHQVYGQLKQFLIVGQRYDLDVQHPLDFSAGWANRLTADVQARGRLHPPAGSDYFIFPRACFTDLPDFTIGRAGWDNWMIFHARSQRIPVIDASSSIVAVHQDHDYSHLPEGKPHYRHPESMENTRLAGGRRTIFQLEDADYLLKNSQVQRYSLHSRKLVREIEIFPLVRLHSKALAEITFAIFHPLNAWRELRGRLAYKLSRKQVDHA